MSKARYTYPCILSLVIKYMEEKEKGRYKKGIWEWALVIGPTKFCVMPTTSISMLLNTVHNNGQEKYYYLCKTKNGEILQPNPTKD